VQARWKHIITSDSGQFFRPDAAACGVGAISFPLLDWKGFLVATVIAHSLHPPPGRNSFGGSCHHSSKQLSLSIALTYRPEQSLDMLNSLHGLRHGRMLHSRKRSLIPMKNVLYSAAVLFLAGGAVCNNQKPVANNPPPVQTADNNQADHKNNGALSYTNDIKPFLATHCVECHGSQRAKAGYNFEGYYGLIRGGRKGAAVVPGEPDRSMVVRVLTGKGKPMPPKNKPQPTAEDVEMLKAWIAAGAKDDSAKSE
jgi:hypothetical protein